MLFCSFGFGSVLVLRFFLFIFVDVLKMIWILVVFLFGCIIGKCGRNYLLFGCGFDVGIIFMYFFVR